MPTEFIDAGRLSHELALESRSAADDGYGGLTDQWNEVASVWGRLEPVTSAAPVWAGQRLDAVTHRVTVRSRDGIAPGMRFRRNGRTFLIRTIVDPDETGRYLVCLTQEESP